MKIILKTLFLVFSMFRPLTGTAQNETNNWYLGGGLNFATSPPTALSSMTLFSSEGCSSISDYSGNLLFYSDGGTVYNKTHSIMANGTGLIGDESTSQSSIVVKKIGSNTLYYLFTLDDMVGAARLGYSVIDMSLAAGMGSVTIKNIVLSDSCAEKLAAVRHCNGTDTWVVVTVPELDQFKAFKVDGNGVNPTPVKSYAGGSVLGAGVQGCMKISPTGKKLGFAGWPNFVGLFDFDNSTGVISNQLSLTSNTFQSAYGCEFSPDGTKFYSSMQNLLFQWDVCAGSNSAIVASQDTVGLLPYIPSAFYFGSMQLGPTGKIYIVKDNSPFNLAVIHNPNSMASACNFSLNGQPCMQGGLGLPNFVSSYFKQMPAPFTYTQGSLSCKSMSFTASPFSTSISNCYAAPDPYTSCKWVFGDPASGTSNLSTSSSPSHEFSTTGSFKVTLILYTNCSADTLRKILEVGCTGFFENERHPVLNIFPNPVMEQLTIEAETASNVMIFDLNGMLIIKESINPGYNEINMSRLKPGIYFVEAKDGESVWRRKVVKME